MNLCKDQSYGSERGEQGSPFFPTCLADGRGDLAEPILNVADVCSYIIGLGVGAQGGTGGIAEGRFLGSYPS